MSDDLDLEPCPGCGRSIDCTLSTCPHCKYDLTGTAPPPKPKKEKAAAKPPTEGKKKKQSSADAAHEGGEGESESSPPAARQQRHPGAGKSCIIVPALGRMARPSIDFPALHWPKGQEPTDDNLLEWALNLRDAWSLPEPRGAGDCQGWLSNHAIGHLANDAGIPLAEWEEETPPSKACKEHDWKHLPREGCMMFHQCKDCGCVQKRQSYVQRMMELLGGDDWKL